MPEPLARHPVAIVDASDAVRRGEIEPREGELVATFHVAPRPVQNHVLAALGTVRRQRGGQ